MRLLTKDEVLTLGAAERDLDWEAMWRAELAKDDRPSDRPKGARFQSVSAGSRARLLCWELPSGKHGF